VGAKWKDIGSVTYGFLVQVYDPEAEVTNNVSSGGIPAEPEGGGASTDSEPVQTPDIPGFGAAVAVIGLLVWVGLAGRRR
jgi:PGF-CTERM protein